MIVSKALEVLIFRGSKRVNLISMAVKYGILVR